MPSQPKDDCSFRTTTLRLQMDQFHSKTLHKALKPRIIVVVAGRIALIEDKVRKTALLVERCSDSVHVQ